MSEPDYPVIGMPASQTNGLAVAGFICSVAGLLTGGLLCPVGLILSLVALGRPSGRGWAIAGIAIGLLGTCLGVVAIFVAGAFIAMAIAVIGTGLGVFALVLTQSVQLEISADMIDIAYAAVVYEDDNGSLPTDLNALELDTPTLTDPWGNAYRYILTEHEPRFEVTSWGADGQPATNDDIRLSTLGKAWERSLEDVDDIKDQLQQWVHKMDRLQQAGVID